MKFRQAMRYPPQVALINAVVRARTFTAAMDDAAAIVQRLRQLGQSGGDFRVLGPAPAPLGKLRGEYRVQFLLKSSSRKRMREALLGVLSTRPDIARRTIVDVDPVSVL
jgi:primosomal protein N' (replication factor Y)